MQQKSPQQFLGDELKQIDDTPQRLDSWQSSSYVDMFAATRVEQKAKVNVKLQDIFEKIGQSMENFNERIQIPFISENLDF
jgi:hypothetical protein